MAPQTAISKAVCYKTKNEQLWEKAVHFLFVATNCFYAGLPTDFCTITRVRSRKGEDRTKKEILRMQDVLLLWRKITRGREQENGAKRRNPVPYRRELALVRESTAHGKSDST